MKVSLVIPFYNEEEGADSVVTQIYEHIKNEPVELVLVNNGSGDRTESLLKKWAKKNNITYVHVHKNKGYGYGIIQGLRASTGDYVGFMDGDGQIHPKEIITCIRALQSHPKIDLIKVRRNTRYDGIRRKVASRGFNFLMHLLFDLQARDVNSVPKIMKRSVYNTLLPLQSHDWFIDAEILLKCQKRQYVIKEIPVVFEQRTQGNSSVKLSTVGEFMKNIIVAKKRM